MTVLTGLMRVSEARTARQKARGGRWRSGRLRRAGRRRSSSGAERRRGRSFAQTWWRSWSRSGTGKLYGSCSDSATGAKFVKIAKITEGVEDRGQRVERRGWKMARRWVVAMLVALALGSLDAGAAEN